MGEFFLYWGGGFALASALVARRRGFLAAPWALVGFLFGPLGLLMAAFQPARPYPMRPNPRAQKRSNCPRCWETIPDGAAACPLCGPAVG